MNEHYSETLQQAFDEALKLIASIRFTLRAMQTNEHFQSEQAKAFIVDGLDRLAKYELLFWDLKAGRIEEELGEGYVAHAEQVISEAREIESLLDKALAMGSSGLH